MKRFVAGADRRHCLPDVACDGHGDQIETADTAVRRIEVKKPLPFAIRRRPTCRQARESDRRTDLVSPLAIEVERQILTTANQSGLTRPLEMALR
jgi:hypothetical protein